MSLYFNRDSSLLVGLSKMYHEQFDNWTLHFNKMEENMDLVYEKLMNKLEEKEEALDTLQKDIQCSFDASSHALWIRMGCFPLILSIILEHWSKSLCQMR
jgi:hypothetical protein